MYLFTQIQLLAIKFNYLKLGTENSINSELGIIENFSALS